MSYEEEDTYLKMSHEAMRLCTLLRKTSVNFWLVNREPVYAES